MLHNLMASATYPKDSPVYIAWVVEDYKEWTGQWPPKWCLGAMWDVCCRHVQRDALGSNNNTPLHNNKLLIQSLALMTTAMAARATPQYPPKHLQLVGSALHDNLTLLSWSHLTRLLLALVHMRTCPDALEGQEIVDALAMHVRQGPANRIRGALDILASMAQHHLLKPSMTRLQQQQQPGYVPSIDSDHAPSSIDLTPSTIDHAPFTIDHHSSNNTPPPFDLTGITAHINTLLKQHHPLMLKRNTLSKCAQMHRYTNVLPMDSGLDMSLYCKAVMSVLSDMHGGALVPIALCMAQHPNIAQLVDMPVLLSHVGAQVEGARQSVHFTGLQRAVLKLWENARAGWGGGVDDAMYLDVVWRYVVLSCGVAIAVHYYSMNNFIYAIVLHYPSFPNIYPHPTRITRTMTHNLQHTTHSIVTVEGVVHHLITCFCSRVLPPPEDSAALLNAILQHTKTPYVWSMQRLMRLCAWLNIRADPDILHHAMLRCVEDAAAREDKLPPTPLHLHMACDIVSMYARDTAGLTVLLPALQACTARGVPEQLSVELARGLLCVELLLRARVGQGWLHEGDVGMLQVVLADAAQGSVQVPRKTPGLIRWCPWGPEGKNTVSAVDHVMPGGRGGGKGGWQQQGGMFFVDDDEGGAKEGMDDGGVDEQGGVDALGVPEDTHQTMSHIHKHRVLLEDMVSAAQAAFGQDAVTCNTTLVGGVIPAAAHIALSEGLGAVLHVTSPEETCINALGMRLGEDALATCVLETHGVATAVVGWEAWEKAGGVEGGRAELVRTAVREAAEKL